MNDFLNELTLSIKLWAKSVISGVVYSSQMYVSCVSLCVCVGGGSVQAHQEIKCEKQILLWEWTIII